VASKYFELSFPQSDSESNRLTKKNMIAQICLLLICYFEFSHQKIPFNQFPVTSHGIDHLSTHNLHKYKEELDRLEERTRGLRQQSAAADPLNIWRHQQQRNRDNFEPLESTHQQQEKANRRRNQILAKSGFNDEAQVILCHGILLGFSLFRKFFEISISLF
jgi:cytochrome c oxidase assembly protein Cox11